MMQFATSDSAQFLFGGQSFRTWMGNSESQPPDIEKEISRALLANASEETSQIQTQESLLSQTYERRQYTSPSTDMLQPGINELPSMLLPEISDQPKVYGPRLPPLRSRLLANSDCVRNATISPNGMGSESSLCPGYPEDSSRCYMPPNGYDTLPPSVLSSSSQPRHENDPLVRFWSGTGPWIPQGLQDGDMRHTVPRYKTNRELVPRPHASFSKSENLCPARSR